MGITDTGSRFASPPCLAGEIAPDYFDPMAVDPEQARGHCQVDRVVLLG
jgi:hypothetical protein